MEIIKKIKNFFKKFEQSNEQEEEYTLPENLFYNTQAFVIPSIEFVQPEVEGRPYILIMDDFKGMVQLVKDELMRVQCTNVTENFNIMMATGNFAAFTVKNFLDSSSTDVFGKEIGVAILDITLGGVVDNIEYDGIDIAIMIKNKYPNCVIKFLTGHTLNKHNPAIFKFITKFENYFKTPIDEQKTIIYKGEEVVLYKHIINKNSNRVSSYGDQIADYFALQKALKD